MAALVLDERCHFSLVIFSLMNQNASGYILDQCCNLQRDGASLITRMNGLSNFPITIPSVVQPAQP